jgi:hypothetical protein
LDNIHFNKWGTSTAGSELDHLTTGFLLSSQLEVLAALDGQLLAMLALGALHAQHLEEGK